MDRGGEWSLATANVIALFVSLRYSILPWTGAQYLCFAMLFGAMLVALAAAELVRAVGHLPRARLWLGVLLAMASLSFRYFESPWLRLNDVLPPQPASSMPTGS